MICRYKNSPKTRFKHEAGFLCRFALFFTALACAYHKVLFTCPYTINTKPMIEATNLKAKPEQHCVVVIKQHKHANKRRLSVHPILSVDIRQVKRDGTVWIQTDKVTTPYQAHKLNTPKVTETSVWIRAERIVQHVDIAEHGSDLDWDQINAMYDELDHKYGWMLTE